MVQTLTPPCQHHKGTTSGYSRPNYQTVTKIYKPKNCHSECASVISEPHLESEEENKDKVTREGIQENPVYKLTVKSEGSTWKTCYGGCNDVLQDSNKDYLKV